jgi:DNA modification methylase
MTIKILIGDALEQLRTLPDNSIDCCVTSPPYWGLRDYGVDGQLGIEPTLAEHIEAMVAVFMEVRRVLTPTGTCWINYGDCYATKPNGRSAADTKAAGNDDRTFRDKPFSTVQGSLKPKDLCMVPNRLAIALQDAGWWVRSEIVWGKPNPMPDSSGRYRPSTAHEKIWLLTKSAKSFYDSEAVRMPAADSSIQRWSQDIENQLGSDRANAGTKTNGRMKAVGARAGRHPTSTLTGGLAGRHETPERYPLSERRTNLEWSTDAQYSKPYEGKARKDYSASSVQNPSEIKRRIVEGKMNGTIPDGRLLRNYEPDLSAIVPVDVWSIATAAFSEAHFATFPPALVAPCIMSGCPVGGTVLDPFFGAGTTGLVADRLQRDCIGIELNPEYAALAQSRIDRDRGGLLDKMEMVA